MTVGKTLDSRLRGNDSVDGSVQASLPVCTG